MKEILGRKVKGLGLASKLGYPTINVHTNDHIDCGIYQGMTNLGAAVVYVVGGGFAECHIIDKKVNDINVGELIHITHLEAIECNNSSDGLLRVMRYGFMYKRLESLLFCHVITLVILVWVWGLVCGTLVGTKWRKAST